VERAAALLLSAVSLPILACSAAAVVVLSRQAPFIAHRRVGLSGQVLWVWKLRTMWSPAQHGESACPRARFSARIFITPRPFFVEFLTDAPVPLNKAAHDPRITSSVALFLRKYSIDELPQLWQVVLGQLALVGPRPLTEAEISRYYGAAMRETLLVVKPGVTGLWQVNGRNRLSYEQRKSFDQYLLSNWSMRLYLKILYSTVFCVVTGKDAH
jgi:exopolysaccharide production protein ExoY